MTSSALAAFSEKFPTDKPCTLWQAVQTNKTHSDPAEKQAVARAMVKDLLTSYAMTISTPTSAKSKRYIQVDHLQPIASCSSAMPQSLLTERQRNALKQCWAGFTRSSLRRVRLNC